MYYYCTDCDLLSDNYDGVCDRCGECDLWEEPKEKCVECGITLAKANSGIRCFKCEAKEHSKKIKSTILDQNRGQDFE